MKTILKMLLPISLLCASIYVGTRYYHYSPFYDPVMRATALIYPTKGNTCSGIVRFEHTRDGLHITASLTGLTPGNHGFHIHEFGNCACDDAVCAGGHFNPTNMPHAGPTDAYRHVGDLGNIHADESGNAQYDFVDTYTTLNGPSSIVGRSVIIHEKADDLKSQPTGDAGGRIGCGVIGITK